MRNKLLYILWGAMYVLCAGLGCISKPEGALYWILFFLAILFFLPPAILLSRSVKAGDRRTVAVIRNLSLIWLAAAMVLVMLNFATVGASAAAGQVLYALLVLVASPMVCGQVWIVPMFLWACLLTAAWQYLKKKA